MESHVVNLLEVMCCKKYALLLLGCMQVYGQLMRWAQPPCSCTRQSQHPR
jgi:hypothetical protein